MLIGVKESNGKPSRIRKNRQWAVSIRMYLYHNPLKSATFLFAIIFFPRRVVVFIKDCFILSLAVCHYCVQISMQYISPNTWGKLYAWGKWHIYDSHVCNGDETLKLMRDRISDTCHSLNELNVTYWLDAGTLLGAMREKDVIKHDYDIDFGYIKDAYSTEKLMLLKEQHNQGPHSDSNSVGIDFTPWFVKKSFWTGQYYLRKDTWRDNHPLVWNVASALSVEFCTQEFGAVFPLQIFQSSGHPWAHCKIPHQSWQYLTTLYGPDVQNPVKCRSRDLPITTMNLAWSRFLGLGAVYFGVGFLVSLVCIAFLCIYRIAHRAVMNFLSVITHRKYGKRARDGVLSLRSA